MARRCTRGHFIPTTAPTDACHCPLTRRPKGHDRPPSAFAMRQTELRDLTDQRASRKALRLADNVPTGSYL
ncbi:hypothetical protein ACIQ6R_13160 [Streptomyces sp. NPDC096048]|uniref:hypothetical protein n=1 Tax=Streptomyces sp. NPDC096048 TaxID=3366072 RepID=UPI00382767BA